MQIHSPWLFAWNATFKIDLSTPSFIDYVVVRKLLLSLCTRTCFRN